MLVLVEFGFGFVFFFFLQQLLLPLHYFFLFDNLTYISTIMEPKGTECYNFNTQPFELRFPFSLWLVQQIGAYKGFFMEDSRRLREVAENVDSETGVCVCVCV